MVDAKIALAIWLQLAASYVQRAIKGRINAQLSLKHTLLTDHEEMTLVLNLQRS